MVWGIHKVKKWKRISLLDLCTTGNLVSFRFVVICKIHNFVLLYSLCNVISFSDNLLLFVDCRYSLYWIPIHVELIRYIRYNFFRISWNSIFMYVYIFVIMIRSLESRLFIESINTHNDNISSPLLKYNTLLTQFSGMHFASNPTSSTKLINWTVRFKPHTHKRTLYKLSLGFLYKRRWP